MWRIIAGMAVAMTCCGIFVAGWAIVVALFYACIGDREGAEMFLEIAACGGVAAVIGGAVIALGDSRRNG